MELELEGSIGNKATGGLLFRTNRITSEDELAGIGRADNVIIPSIDKQIVVPKTPAVYDEKTTAQDLAGTGRISFRSNRTSESPATISYENGEQYSKLNLGSVSSNIQRLYRRSFSTKLTVSPLLLINLVAIIGLIYGVITIYAINERSKLAQESRRSASSVAQLASYDVSVKKLDKATSAKQGPAPTRIEIGSIGVNATVDEMGLTANNHIEAPVTNYTAGWYNKSAGVAGQGATIIDGHLGTNIDPGVFWNLEEIEVEDTITIYATSGELAHYIVREIEVVDRNSSDFDKFYSPIGDERSGLNIITCSGGYLQHEQTYDSRLIVYAEQVFA